jgi:diguanylate cyclase (GGDEF)-like protein/PAS domain S-box-containing protein
MRISTRLTSVVAIVFLIVGGVGALALERLRDIGQRAVEVEARNFATAVATMAGYEIGGRSGPQRHAKFQDVISYIASREQRDMEIFDARLVILADETIADIGKPIEAGPRRAIVARTLSDGVPRFMLEPGAAGKADMRQVVVPIYDARRAIVAALVYEYTPLFSELAGLAEHSLRTLEAVALAGMLLALGCAAYISRRVSRPIAHLTEAAQQLAQGRRNVTVKAGTRDELGELATVFNSMSAALGASEASLQERASDLLQANQALHLRERAMASSFNAIIIADLTRPGFPIEYVNPAFERITGYSAAEALGMGSDFLAGDDLAQPALHELARALRERREAHAVVRSYRKDGTPFWNEVYVAPVRDDGGAAGEHYVAIFNDVTRARNDAEQVARQAQFDALTGLANRSLLLDRLNQAIANARRNTDSLVVAFIDLDGFKVVNDNLGHDVGNQVLQAVAERLQECVRASDTVARFGGDDFVLLLLNQGDPALEAHTTEAVRKLLECVAAPLAVAGHQVKLSCSIGVASYPQDGADADALVRHADTAMYRAKELGGDGFQFFTAALQERASRQLALGASLRLALERGQFELHYQPQVSLRSGKVVGIEALLRWRHPEQGLLGPGHFIGFAEETGLIIPIGEWVMRTACAQNKAWQDAGLAAIPVAVNVSARQFAQPGLEAVVRSALDESGLAPRYLELELTESISMADPENSVPLMQRLKDIGVELSLDDFGTGYSNMSYLRRFPIDRLKLDISFVRDISTDPSSLAISDAIITMAHSLHLEVVAEGVETEGQLALLASRHCDIIQGFHFSRPLAVPDLERLLREDRRLPAALAGALPRAPELLVLDDDAHLLAYLDLVLSTAGYTVHATADPQAAFELLACREIAVVLCDQRMPHMSGVEFLSRVRPMYPRTMRIMLSAYDDYEVTREAINLGAVYKFLRKPIDLEQLTEVVEEAFRLYQHKDAPKLARNL